MPRLADTTLRLLGQEPLAGQLPTAEQLRLAEILDGAGFAYLEVSGGGCFETAVRRGIESPWERIRAIRSRTKTPLAMALRGRFLVGSRPVSVDLAQRFVACAAESGIDVFRLHDPLNDVSNLREAATAITAAGREFDAGLVHSPSRTEDTDLLAEQAKRLPELGAARVLIHDPSGSLSPQQAANLVGEVRKASGLPVGLYCQGAGGVALAATLEAARAGADLIACAVYPLALTLHRVSAESAATALAGLGLDSGVDADIVWEASDLVDEFIGDEPLTPTAPRVATLAAQHRLPPGLVAALDLHLRANAAVDRIDEVLDELARIRAEVGSPPLASPIGQILGSQALVHVLSAERYQTVVDELKALIAGHFGSPPAAIDPTVARAVELIGGEPPEEQPVDVASAKAVGEGLATSDEELCLLALFGEDAEPLLRTIRGRGQRDDDEGAAAQEPTRSERIREIVRIVQESGVQEVTLEDAGMRVTVRRNDESAAAPSAPLPSPVGETSDELEPVLETSRAPGLLRIEAPMVGTFYRAPEPGANPFVGIGDVVIPGQTLCILEAMKLMNEVKVEHAGIVRAIHAENAQPVEYGQLLFELELADGRPPVPLGVVFQRVLIANRGEIAVRVIRTLHELGIEAVAVYSTADRGALHTRLADRAVCIGPPSAAESYLSIPSVIAAAVTTGCEAIHPGYGFLAENPAFVLACADSELVFIGPGAEVMEEMGDKVRAKTAMASAGVPVVPGTDGVMTAAEARAAADEFGYPVLLKAAAGGGGKGMRLVSSPAELEETFQTASLEALAAFGDGRVYVEKALVPARHVEVQVLADREGNVLTLGERECSIQRRHQKLVEESPSPALTPERREEMEAAAERACRAVGYVNAGTFEFLVGPDGAFHFIELNARLQVEHPVSELVTGIDIVREQLRIAAGEPLILTGRAPRGGHAIEVRLNAEDPAAGFAPSPGRVTRFRPPLGPFDRVDTHIEDGTVVSSHYDSLLAKVIVWGADRSNAIVRCRLALAELEIEGVRTTRELAIDIMNSEGFVAGSYSTSFLDEAADSLLALRSP